MSEPEKNRKPRKPRKPQPRKSQKDKKPEADKAISTATITPQGKLIDTFNALTASIPRDNNNFLLYLLDHTHIPEDILQRPEKRREDILRIAKIPLSMREGYLSVNFNVPVWNKLAHEPENFYSAFHAYLCMPARNLYELQENLPGLSTKILEEAYTFYYWEERSKAYDILQPVAASKIRDQRVMMAEDQHYIFTNRALSMLGDELSMRLGENNDGRPFADLHSKDMMSIFVDMMKMQRISLHLPANGVSQTIGDHVPSFSSSERAIEESSRQFHGTSEASTTADSLKARIHDAIASSPEDAERLQEAAMAVLVKTHASINEGKSQK